MSMTIAEQLKRQIDGWEQIGGAALMERFVLRNGKPFVGTAFSGRRGTIKECYCNALEYADKDRSLLYVEGYAIRKNLGLLIQHAWAAKPDSDLVIDPTWDDPADCAYFGVTFTREAAWREALKSGVYGLLAPHEMLNTELMFARDPGLAEWFAQFKARTVRAAS